MTRHESFKKSYAEAYDYLERKRAFPQERHNQMIEHLLVSIAGSLALIADALNPKAAAVKDEDDTERRTP